MSITFETARINGLPGVAPTMISFGTPPGAGSWGITIEQEGAMSVVMAQTVDDGKSVTGNIDAETATTLIEDAIATLRTRGAKAHRPEIDRLRVALSDVALYGVEGEVMRSIVSSPTVCGRYTVTQLLLDDRTLECISVIVDDRELHITREDGRYSVEWGDDWSPAPIQAAITALLEIDDLDDEVLDALETAALDLGRQRSAHPDATPQTDSAPLIERSHNIMILTSNTLAREGMELARVTHLSHYGAGFRLTLEQAGAEILITHAGAKVRLQCIETPIDPHEAKQILEDLRMALRKRREEHPEALALVDSAVRGWVTDVTHSISDEPEDDDLDDEAADLELGVKGLGKLADEAGKGTRFEPGPATDGILADLTERAAAEVMDSARTSASTRRLPLAWLTLDPRCQPRDGLDEETVVRYASILREGTALPAINVVENPSGPERWVTDGYHRVEAHRRAGAVTIEAQITQGSLRDAIWASTAANATHGLTRSRADLHRAIETLIGDEEWAALSDRELARHISCDGKTIAAARKRRQGAELPQPAPAEERQEHPLDRHYQRAEALLGERREPAQTSLVTSERAELPQEPTPAAPQPIIEEAPLRCAHTVDIEEISSDEWYTPRDVVEMARVILGGIGLDPASCSVAQEVVKADVHWTAQDDALTRDWGAAEARTVWLNPPYSRALIAPFAKKFLDEWEAQSFEEALVLVNASVCATWWQDLARKAQLIAYPPKRLAFWRASGGEGSGNFYDSSLLYFGGAEDALMVAATIRSCGWLVTSGGAP